MDVATFAFILGVYECLVGIPLILNPRATFLWFVRSQENNDALLRVVGAMFLVMGLLVLTGGARITADVTGFVRLLAWVTVFKCLALCWCPHVLLRIQQRFLTASPLAQRLMGVVALALGLFMLWASCFLRCGGCCGVCG